MNKFVLVSSILAQVMAWFPQAAADKEITPEEIAALLVGIAKSLGVENKLSIHVD